MSHQKQQGRYRKVQVKTWTDDNFRELSSMAKLLWFFLLTGPQTGPIPGLYRAGRAAMAEELEWPLEDFYTHYAELEARGMVRADWKARLVWLPNAMKHNQPESPNVVKSWRAELALLPECALKLEALAHIRQTVANMGLAFLAAFDEGQGGESAAAPASPAPPSPKPTPQALPEALPEALHKAVPEALPEALPQDIPESGTGTGTGAGTPPAAGAHDDQPDPDRLPPRPTRAMLLADHPPDDAISAGEIAKVMRPYGINCNPGHPTLLKMAADKVALATVQAACEEAKQAKQGEAIGVAFVAAILERWAKKAATQQMAGATAPKPNAGAWWASDPAILAKGAELGLSPNMGEQMQAFKGRIDAALANGGKPPPQPSQSRITALPPPEPKRTKPEGLDLHAYLRKPAPATTDQP